MSPEFSSVESESFPRGRMKGASTEVFLSWYAESVGVARLAEVVESMPEEYRRMFGSSGGRPTLITMQWYPSELVHCLLDRLLDGFSRSEWARFAEGVAEASVGGTLRGIYRPIFKLLVAPASIPMISQRIWRKYHDTGDFNITSVGPTRHRSELSKWKGHHRFMCDMRVAVARLIYAEAGCKDVRIRRTRCVSDGASSCVLDISWSE